MKLIDHMYERVKYRMFLANMEKSIWLSKKKERIKVAFYVIFDSIFQFETLYLMMQKNPKVEEYILVIPDIFHGEKNKWDQMKRTYYSLKEKGYKVYHSYDVENKKYIDYSKEADLVCICNPYDILTEKYYRIEYLAKLGIPTIYVSYSYCVSNIFNFGCEEYKYLWRFFAPNSYEKEQIVQTNYSKGKNVLVCGYAKMDALTKYQETERKRKRIIIAPHHTVLQGDFSISTFLKYSEFWLQLPEKYPEVDFVFRPHPLLKAQLLNVKGWSKDKIEIYFEKMKGYANVEYQEGGDYMQTFVNSDALIHDCASFMAEYLFTGKPALFLLKDKESDKIIFNSFARNCIQHHYQAYEEEDICNFIEEIVISEKDSQKEERRLFAEKSLRYKFPYTTEYIYTYVLKRFNAV